MKSTLIIPKITLRSPRCNPKIFVDVRYAFEYPGDHRDIARQLKNKNPYFITILIEPLLPDLWNRKEYVKHRRVPIESKYRESLFHSFFKEYGRNKANEIYAGWLRRYEPEMKRRKDIDIDEYIIKHELESRYRDRILKRYKNHEQLFRPRYRIDRDRYYRVPEPFSQIDWRNPYDNIFIWHEGNQKFARRGGSGGSGQREINSKFIFGFALINQMNPVPSYLFIYSERNQLIFVKRFRSFTVPGYDVGSNYLLSHDEKEQVLKGTKFLTWKSLGPIRKITCSDKTAY